MKNVYWDACFSQKVFTDGRSISLQLRAFVKKKKKETVRGVENTLLSAKGKVPVAASCKENHLGNFLWHEKGATVNKAFNCQRLKQYSPYLLNVPRIYTHTHTHTHTHTYIYIYIYIYISKVGDRSRGQPEGSLFNSYNTEE